MNLKVLVICALMAMPAIAGKIVTYTATSNVSQEEANNAAMAGVAKQVSSQIKVDQTLSIEETTIGNKSVYNENYRASNKVKTDIKIKGISVKPVQTDKGFKATATLDMDEFTADIQFKMKSIQKEISALETKCRKALDERQYLDAISAVESAKPLIQDYNYLVNQLGQVYPINDSHRLKHNVPALEAELVHKLTDIQIQGPTEAFTLSKPDMQPWDVVVSDKNGTVSNFPLVARQGRNVLAEKRTQENGTATFTLRGINIDKGPYVIVVEPAISEELLKAAGLRQKFEVDFKVKQARCAIRLECNEGGSICSALEKSLAKKSIYNDDVPGAPVLQLAVTTRSGQPIEYIPGKFTTPYDVDVSLKGNEITFIGSGHENGKKESDAVAAVLKKMDFSKLQKQLDAFCQ